MLVNKSFIVKLTILIFLAIIYLPIIQSYFRFFPEVKLYGEVAPTIKTKIIWQNWFNGSIQDYLESRLDNKLGFRGYFVKTDNQLNFWSFKEIHQKTQNKLIVGKNNYIFEKSYIETYIGRDVADYGKLEERIKKMKALQEALKEKGSAFIFLISPGKAGFYPELIPKSQLSEGSGLVNNANYKMVVSLLNKYEINYFDGRDYFLGLKGKAKFPLFPKAGTHWSVYGSCLAAAKTLEKSGQLIGRNLVLPNCENVEISNYPLWQDRDLADLTNLWFVDRFNETLAYPKSEASSSPSHNDLNLLLIGDSFSWNLLRNFTAAKSLQSYDFYYYFNSRYSYPKNSSLAIKKTPEELERNILEHNLIIIEANETALPDIGFGFIDAALEALE